MKLTILSIALVSLLMTGCTRPEQTVSILQSQGFKNIKTSGWGLFTLFQCSEDDVFKTPFSAVAPSGNTVSGVVCSGLLKGSTVRFD
jgi:hypothetical protein